MASTSEEEVIKVEKLLCDIVVGLGGGGLSTNLTMSRLRRLSNRVGTERAAIEGSTLSPSERQPLIERLTKVESTVAWLNLKTAEGASASPTPSPPPVVQQPQQAQQQVTSPPPSVMTITITALHNAVTPIIDAVRSNGGAGRFDTVSNCLRSQGDSATKIAVVNFLTKSALGASAVAPSSDDSPSSFFKGPASDRSYTLFTWRLPAAAQLREKDDTGKQKWQRSFSDNSGQGYLAASSGEDLWGLYDMNPAGSFVTISVRLRLKAANPSPADIELFSRFLQHEHLPELLQASTTDIDPAVEWKEDTTNANSVVPFWMQRAFRGGGGIPWHVLHMEAYKFALFLDRFRVEDEQTLPRQQQRQPQFPPLDLFPLSHREADGQPTWSDQVLRTIEDRPCDTEAAKAMLDSLLVDGKPNAAVTGFLLRGLPGTGKTTVAEQLCFSLGVRPVAVPIGKLMGSLVGDASAAMEVLFGRGFGECGLAGFILDEVDLIANPKDEKNKETITQLLDRFTAARKSPNTCVLTSTNNEKSILGAIMSRFSDSRVVCAPRFAWYQQFFADHRDHPFVAGLVTDEERSNVTKACVGLTARDVIDVPAASTRRRGLLCEDRQLKKGNRFAVNQLQRVSPLSIACHRLGEEAQPLAAFLAVAVRRDLITGRMVLYSDLGDRGQSAFLDIEVREVPTEFETDGSFLFREGHLTRCYGPLPIMDIYKALLDAATMRECNATHFNYVTEEFMTHVLGAAQEESVDDRRSVAVRLMAEYCQTFVDGSVLVVPQSMFFVDPNSSAMQSGSKAGNKAAMEAFVTTMFKESPPSTYRWTVAHCTIGEEVRQLASASGFHLSSLLELKLSTLEPKFTCVRCEKPDVSDGEKGCSHTPSAFGSRQQTPSSSSLRLRVTMRDKCFKDQAPFLTSYSNRMSFENVSRIEFPLCGCVSHDPAQFLTIARMCNKNKKPHDECAPMMLTKRSEVEDVRTIDADGFDRQVDLSQVQSVKVNCALCSGDVGPEGRLVCPASSHIRPSMTDFLIPLEERNGSALCPKCPVERNQGRIYCRLCARLLLPQISTLRCYGFAVLGQPHRCFVDSTSSSPSLLTVPRSWLDAIRLAVGRRDNSVTSDRTPIPMYSEHERKTDGNGACEHCGVANAARDLTVWMTQMRPVRCRMLPRPPALETRGHRTIVISSFDDIQSYAFQAGDGSRVHRASIEEIGRFSLVDQGGTIGGLYLLIEGVRRTTVHLSEMQPQQQQQQRNVLTEEVGVFYEPPNAAAVAIVAATAVLRIGHNTFMKGFRRRTVGQQLGARGSWVAVPRLEVFEL